MKNSLRLLVLIGGACLLNACGGGSSTKPQTPFAITSQALPNGMTHTMYAGSPNGFSLTALGGTAPYHWSWAAANGSSLPPGLNVSNASVSGTPTATGSFSVIVTATDSASPAARQTANYTIQITAPGSLSITSTSLPEGTVDAVYGGGAGFTLSGSGGVTPYAWSWTAANGSSLPQGLSLSNGSISGTPTLAGSYQVMLTVTDSELPPAHTTSNLTVVIESPPPPAISSSPAPPAGAVNVPYSGFTFKVTVGLAPLTWSETGALPPGMVFGADGTLSGTPTATGSFPIAVAVQDAVHQNAPPQDFTIEIDAKLPSFTATGSMQTARASHTATLLGNGKVIVIGGVGDSGKTVLASTELFDPAVGQFTSTGNLMTPRSNHAATLLKSGQVLVTGGQDVNGNAIAEAELLDPSTGSFATIGSINTARTGHTAILLNDGRVLIAGGIDSNKALLSTAELFDPATGKFTPANGPMTAARANHTATLLSSGKVLVAGGAHDTVLVDIFDPASNTFTSTTTIGDEAEVTFFTATLLADGRVLVAGGEVTVAGCPPVRPTRASTLASASLFDSGSASFSATGYMSSYRAHHTATVLGDRKVLVAGGSKFSTGFACNLTISVLATAELYDPVHGAFALTSSMTAARSQHTATLLANGDVLVVGGADTNNNPLASAELYH